MKLVGSVNAEIVQKLMGQLRQLPFLDLLDLESHLHRLAAQTRVGDRIGEFHVHDALVAGVGAFDLFAELLRHSILECQARIDADRHFLHFAKQPVAVARSDVADNDIVDLRVSLGLRHHLAVRRQQATLFAHDVFVAERLHGPAQLETFVIWQVELRSHFHFELINERSVFGELNLERVEVRSAERRDIEVLRDRRTLAVGHAVLPQIAGAHVRCDDAQAATAVRSVGAFPRRD